MNEDNSAVLKRQTEQLKAEKKLLGNRTVIARRTFMNQDLQIKEAT